MQIDVEKLSSEQRELLRDIEKRWRNVPPLRVASSIDDACQDWPLGEFDDDVWLATRNVHASEMLMSSAEICEVMSKSRDDVRALFRLIGQLLEER